MSKKYQEKVNKAQTGIQVELMQSRSIWLWS